MESLPAWGWLIVLVTLVTGFVPAVLYILTMHRALEAIDPPLRPVSPAMAWLAIVPVFNLLWIFFLVTHLKNGYERMHRAGRLTTPTTAGFQAGMGMAISWILCFVPWVSLVAWIPGLALWILHWLKVSQARQLVRPASTEASHGAPLMPEGARYG